MDKLLYKIVSRYFYAIDKYALIVEFKGQLFINGDIIKAEEKRQLNTEVEAFKRMRIYTIFQELIRDESNKRMFQTGRLEDLIFNKAMLYNLDVLKHIVNILETKAVTAQQTSYLNIDENHQFKL